MKILIIRLSSLGDIVLTEPICALLHDSYPQAEIHYVCKQAFADLPVLFATEVKVIPYDKSLQFHWKLRETKYDIVIDLHGKLASILLMLISRAGKKLSYNKQRSIRKAIVKGNTNLNIDSTVQLYMSSLKKLGIGTSWQYPKLMIPPNVSLDIFQDILPNTIAIFPSATHFTKRYPADMWIDFINRNNGYNYALFGSNYDAPLCNAIATESSNPCANYAGIMGYEDLLIALKRCVLVISGDTGPMHLAAAINMPQIAIFGGTHPRLGFRPLNAKAKILSMDLSCQPCSLHGEKACPLGHFNCMRLLEADKIANAIQDFQLSKASATNSGDKP
ncbi:MAG: glycosyltransferase family 9 protein [Candidatus Cloacimonetes bacterium]|nr:glycosyltransferase family 9 protein [Candidatus Cloacimonadota bacterium]